MEIQIPCIGKNNIEYLSPVTLITYNNNYINCMMFHGFF